MPDRSERFSEEVDELRAMRDELRVQMHLARAEARERWEKLEGDWARLEGRLKRVREEAREDSGRIADAGRALIQEIRNGYEHLKSLL